MPRRAAPRQRARRRILLHRTNCGGGWGRGLAATRTAGVSFVCMAAAIRRVMTPGDSAAGIPHAVGPGRGRPSESGSFDPLPNGLKQPGSRSSSRNTTPERCSAVPRCFTDSQPPRALSLRAAIRSPSATKASPAPIGKNVRCVAANVQCRVPSPVRRASISISPTIRSHWNGNPSRQITETFDSAIHAFATFAGWKQRPVHLWEIQ